MLTEREIERILSAALGKGGGFADIYFERKETNGITCEADRIEKIHSGVDFGAGIRVVFQDRTAYAYTNDVSLEGLLQAANVVNRAMKRSNGDVSLFLNETKAKEVSPIKYFPGDIGIEEKVALVERGNAVAWALDSRIQQVAVGYGDTRKELLIANSEGLLRKGHRISTRMVASVVVGDKGIIQTGYEAAGGTAGFEYFTEIASPEDICRKAAARAVMMLDSRPAPAGRMAVVMGGEAGGTMVHEACGHGLEADLVQKGLSVYAGKTGQKVASDLITVYDDATVPNKYGSFAFDDEGVESQNTVLIENGILTGYMYDYLTSQKENRASTGNGRRESYKHKPIPRMTNTCIAPGEYDPDEIIARTPKGLYVKKMGGGQVNTTNGDFVFDVSEGYLIENGKITAPVRGATLTGNGPEVLRIIDMVGGDLGWAIGTCGKDGQGVPVSDAQPTLRIPEIVVGGILE
jgi:TldD protein